jgi:hypothetical protein
MEAYMAKKKLEVSLSPIAAEIDKAAEKLRNLKSRVSPADRLKVASELKDLLQIRKLVANACGKRMTREFLPKPGER